MTRVGSQRQKKHQWDPKDVRSFLTLVGSHKGLMMTLQGRNMSPMQL